MKSLIAAFAILAVAVATITGIVLAQPPNNSQSTDPIAKVGDDATAVRQCVHPVLGKILFEHVTSVHFCGADMPANSDGSFGGWVGEEDGVPTQMTIYENFIVKETALPDGASLRETRPYDKLGNIKQRIPAKAKRQPDAK